MKRLPVPLALALSLILLALTAPMALTAPENVASSVWGQPNLTTTRCKPVAVSLCAPAQSTTDAQGNLWVADFDHNRVLMYAPGSTAAGKVFGQYGSYSTDGCDQRPPAGQGATTHGERGSSVRYPAAPSRYTLCEPMGVAVDPHGTLYISDSANQRVLVYFRAADKPKNTPADLVLGQTNFSSTGSNDVAAGGRGMDRCPAPHPASRCTLDSPMELSITAEGDLLVADYYNYRVLLWQASVLAHVPAGACDTRCFIPASRVWGQYGSFATRLANNPVIPAGQSGRCTSITLETLASPCTLNGPSAAIMDREGDLFVSDTGNNRVLEYDRALQTDRQDATRVYGQGGSFTTINWNIDGVAATSLWHPLGLAIDGAGHLWVADFRNMRVLRFPALGTADATTADHALGQADDFSASQCALDASGLCGPISIAFDGAGHAFVSDALNSRVLEYVNPE